MLNIRSIAICPDDPLLVDLRNAALSLAGALDLVRRIPYYPQPDEVEKLIRTYAPDLILVEATDPVRLQQVTSVVERVSPGLPVVAVSREKTTELLLPCLRAGVQDFLVAPFDIPQMDAMLRRVMRQLRERPADLWHSQSVFSFISAKPGSGATTLACHTALEISRQGACRPVVFDLDSRSSILDFMLQLRKRHSMIEAAAFACELDESLWEQLVARVQTVDYVSLGESTINGHMSGDCVGSFIDYARRHYDLVCLDLPSRIDDETLPLLHRSSTIFLVCTPEVGSLHLARRRLTQLENEGLLDRVRVVVNRVAANSERTAALPSLLRHDVFATLGNSYEPLQRAIENGRPADRRSAFGRGIEKLAARCLGQEPKRETWKLPEFLRALLTGREPEQAASPFPRLLEAPPPAALTAIEESKALTRRTYIH